MAFRRDMAGMLQGGLLLVLLVLAQTLLAGGRVLIQRPLWLDEVHTLTLVGDPDLGHSLQALRNGVDYNPPGLYLLLRGATCLAGRCDADVLRWFALGSVMLAMLAVYGTACRFCTPLVALAVAVSVWIQPLVCEHAFEARFYGVWLAAMACVAFLFVMPTKRGIRAWFVCGGLAAASVLTCTVHYFGVISLGIFAVGQWLVRRVPASESAEDQDPARGRLAKFLCLACGPLSLLFCIPFYLGQRDALTIATWVPATTWGIVGSFFGEVLAWPLMLAAVAAIAWRMRSPGAEGGWKSIDWHPALRCAGVVLLLSFPALLVLASLVVQPFLIARYAVPAALGVFPILACLLPRLRSFDLIVWCACLLLLGGLGIRSRAQTAAAQRESLQRLIGCLEDTTETTPIIFDRRHDMYPVVVSSASLAPRCHFWDWEETADRPVHPLRIVERDVGRRFAEYYARFPTISLAEIQELDEFVYVAQPEDSLPEVMRDGQVTPLDKRVFLVLRRSRSAERPEG
jgi:hypothetical protein